VLEEQIRPHLETFCARVSVEDLCHIIEKEEDVYPLWLEEFSTGETRPKIAVLFEGEIRKEVKKVLAEACPEHFRLFAANPAWSERQLDGLFGELFG